MKDAYSFDVNEDGLDKNYKLMKKAYCDIFKECGLDFIIVEEDPGIMGGSQSAEFMVYSESGEDFVVSCGCGAAFSLSVAPCFAAGTAKKDIKQSALREVSTPSKTTAEEVSRFLKITSRDFLKTIIYTVEGEKPVAILVRGDHRVNETKLEKALGTNKFNLADEKTILKLANSKVGFSGPVNLKGIRIIADYAVGEMSNFVCGANKNDTHLMGVNEPRDFKVDKYADLRFIEDGDICPKCRRKKIELKRAIEVGHIFKQGTRYSQVCGAAYLDVDQKEKPVIMGCYGLGINRIIAACIEQNHDDKGICWPSSLSPFVIVIVVLNPLDKDVIACAQDTYKKLSKAGMDVLMDIRDRKAGVKLKDADLIGFHMRLLISPRTLSKGIIEVSLRKAGQIRNVKIDKIEQEIKKLLDKD